ASFSPGLTLRSSESITVLLPNRMVTSRMASNASPGIVTGWGVAFSDGTRARLQEPDQAGSRIADDQEDQGRHGQRLDVAGGLGADDVGLPDQLENADRGEDGRLLEHADHEVAEHRDRKTHR